MDKLTDLFSEKVRGAREALPQVAVTLEASHRARLARIDDPSVRRFHRAIDDLLQYLGRTGTAFEVVDRLRPLRILLRRAASDFEIAAEAILAAHDGVTMTVMRDVMEVEYLVRDFAQDLERIPDWIACDESDRWFRFGPAKLRKREAGRRGVEPNDLPDKRDYERHSTYMHVNPFEDPLVERGVGRQLSPHTLLYSGWDMVEHGRRLVVWLQRLQRAAGSVVHPDAELDAEYPHLAEAVVHCGIAHDILSIEGLDLKMGEEAYAKFLAVVAESTTDELRRALAEALEE